MSDDDPLAALLRQAQALGSQLASAQQAAGTSSVEGSAGGGIVRVVLGGDFEFRSVHIDPGVVDPADVGMLEDLLLAALVDATAKARQAREEAVVPALGSLLEGFGFGDFDDQDEPDEAEEPDDPAGPRLGIAGPASSSGAGVGGAPSWRQGLTSPEPEADNGRTTEPDPSAEDR